MNLFKLKSIKYDFKKLEILITLFRDAGWKLIIKLLLLNLLSNLVSLLGVGILLSYIFNLKVLEIFQFEINYSISLNYSIFLLFTLIIFRTLLQVKISLSLESLKISFGNSLKNEFLKIIVFSPSHKLEKIGRSNLQALLFSEIDSSVFALDNGVKTLQNLITILIYILIFIFLSNENSLPIFLSFFAIATASLFQRSGAWVLGKKRLTFIKSINRIVSDGLYGLKAIRAAGAQDWFLKQYKIESNAYKENIIQYLKNNVIFNFIKESLLFTVVIIWALLFLKDLSIEYLITILLVSYRCGNLFSNLITSQRFCINKLPSYESLYKTRSKLNSPKSNLKQNKLKTFLISNIDKYKGFKEIHWQTNSTSKRKDIALKKGNLIVITGESGVGKTTLIEGFCGLLNENHSKWIIEFNKKEITLKGANGSSELKNLIAYSPQNTFLFETTLRENLLFDNKFSNFEISKWFKQIGLDHLLENNEILDEKLSTTLNALSGGEIHRLGLLRTWLRDLPIEILDEPTAYLDEITSRKISKIISDRSKYKFSLVSSHDPYLIDMADEIIELKKIDREDLRKYHV